MVLDGAGLQDPFPDDGRGLCRESVREFLVLHRRCLHMEVDAVEEGARDLLAVAFDLFVRAAAIPLRVAVVTAGAGVHRGHKHEGGGECHGSRGAGDRHLAILQRLTHHFEGRAVELGQFVQEEDAVMGEAHFARGDVRGTPQQPDVGDGVMGIAEGTAQHDRFSGGEEAADGMDLGGLDRLLERHRWHDGRDAAR